MAHDEALAKVRDETTSADEEDQELYTVVARRTKAGAPASAPSPMQAEEGDETPYHKIDFIADVPLRLSVEIGQTTMTVREILALTTGSSVEFTKVVGEPMDITISGRLMARGEIVVVNERYGVRISEVTRPDETGPIIQNN
jgi:flagellar motor switch protein FliN/FliY